MPAAEVVAAEIRRQAIIADQANHSYPGVGAPAWFAPAIAPIVNGMAAGFAQLNHMEGRGQLNF